MDLLSCPKCGDAWRKGAEKCFKCGFVPIGVGLDKIKKKRKRVGRYVEPGSWRGFLSFGTVAGVMTFCAVKQPWTDDWEMVRSLFGQGRHHSVVGKWEIVKTVAVNKDKALFTIQKVRRGVFNFGKNGELNMDLKSGKVETHAQGHYQVAGTLVAVKELAPEEGSTFLLPKSMSMNLAWTGPDSVVASCYGSEAVYLRRVNEKNGMTNLISTGVKPGSGETPAGVQDMAGKISSGAMGAGEDKE